MLTHLSVERIVERNTPGEVRNTGTGESGQKEEDSEAKCWASLLFEAPSVSPSRVVAMLQQVPAQPYFEIRKSGQQSAAGSEVSDFIFPFKKTALSFSEESFICTPDQTNASG